MKRTADYLRRLRRRLKKLKLPADPTYGLDMQEIKNLAGSSDEGLIAWAVTLKLNPPIQPSAREFASFLSSQSAIYDREIIKDIRPTNSWIGMMETAPFK